MTEKFILQFAPLRLKQQGYTKYHFRHTISDVIVYGKYTASEGGSGFKTAANSFLKTNSKQSSKD